MPWEASPVLDSETSYLAQKALDPLMGTWLATTVQALTPLSKPKYLGE
jgi:hypothetical protein